MSNPLENLLSVKGIIGTIVFVFMVVILLLVINELKESPLGQNEQAKETLESAENSINILTNGYFIAGSIAGIIALIAFFVKSKRTFFTLLSSGIIALIAFFVWLFKKFEDNRGMI